MRDYGSVSPKFWTAGTGKSLRGDLGAQVVALYLMTSPHANMIGVFYCPIDFIAKETGMTIEGASKALHSLIEADFCRFDEATEEVFVCRMAAYQIGEQLDPKDKRCVGVARELEKVSSDRLRIGFRANYAVPFNLPVPTTSMPIPASPSEAPSEPHRSQKQEQEQKQEEGSDEPADVQKEKQPKSASSFVLPDWIPKDPWDGFEEMRKKLKKPMTDRARVLKVTELQRFADSGHDVGDILDKSTANSWTDLYEPKEGAQKRQERFV